MNYPWEKDEAVKLGKLEKDSTPFEQEKVDYSWNDHESLVGTIVGDYDYLRRKNILPGSLAKDAGLDSLNNYWYVRTVDISREGANVGVMTLNCVYCPKGATTPYSVTWEVAMEEVQKALITHPMFRDEAEAIEQIRGWERYRTISANATKSGGFYYMNGAVEKKVEDEKALKYCHAVSEGIETYNLYLPVISKTSMYLRLPGVTYAPDSNSVTGGSVDCADKIGKFDTPDVKVDGVSGGKWFKSRDTYTQAADGSWTRTEQWTYTNDVKHSWIYEELD